jgi:hypothetical protein
MTPEERGHVERALRYTRSQLWRGWWPGCAYVFIALVGGATVGLLASGLLGGIVSWLLERLGLPTSVVRFVFTVLLVGGPVIGFLAGLRMLWKDAAAATSSSVTRGQALELDLTEN